MKKFLVAISYGWAMASIASLSIEVFGNSVLTWVTVPATFVLILFTTPHEHWD